MFLMWTCNMVARQLKEMIRYMGTIVAVKQLMIKRVISEMKFWVYELQRLGLKTFVYLQFYDQDKRLSLTVNI